MAEHDPGVVPANGDPDDAVVGTHLEAPLVRGALGIRCSVVGLEHVALKRVGGEVVVRRADVGVRELVADKIERPAVVSLGVEVVDHNAHAVLCRKVEEVLLLVAHHHGDVRDAALEELTNLALDEHLALYAEHALGTFVGERDKAAGQAGRHDDGVADAVRLKRFDALLGDAPVSDEAIALAGSNGGVHGAEREPGLFGDGSLGKALPGLREGAQDAKLVPCKRHGCSLGSDVHYF